jgi:hypothetical protein
MGLSGDEQMTPELQDEIGKYVYKTQGRGAWEALKNGRVTMSSMGGPTSRDEASIDVSDLEENAPDMSEEAQQNRRIGSMFVALGEGLSQMSHGKPVDISDVMNSYLDRQSEMQQRMQEIAMEKRRQTERKEDWTHDEQVAVRGEQRRENAAIRAEGREKANTQAERERIAAAASGSLEVMYPDAPWLPKVQQAMEIDPVFGTKFAEMQIKEDDENKKLALEQETYDDLAQFYTDQGHPDLAEIARNGDTVGARDAYKDRTGSTNTMKDARVLQYGTEEEKRAMMQRINAESGFVDPVYGGLVENELTAQKELQTEQSANRHLINQVRQAVALAQDPNLDQGALEAKLLPMEQILKSAGINIKGVSKKEVFKAATEALVPLLRVPGDLMSNVDVDRYRDSTLQLGNTREGNIAIGQAQIESARRADEYINARVSYMAQGGNIGDRKAQTEYIKNYMEKESALGGVYVDMADDSQENTDRVARAWHNGLLTEGTVVYGPNNELIPLTAAHLEQMEGLFGAQ